MQEKKTEKINKNNTLATSVKNDVSEVKVGDLTYKTSISDSSEKIEGEKSVEILEKALKEGVFSDLKNNETKDK